MLMKEATDEDRSLKTQLLLSTAANSEEKISGERVWRDNGFFWRYEARLETCKKICAGELSPIYKSGLFINC